MQRWRRLGLPAGLFLAGLTLTFLHFARQTVISSDSVPAILPEGTPVAEIKVTATYQATTAVVATSLAIPPPTATATNRPETFIATIMPPVKPTVTSAPNPTISYLERFGVAGAMHDATAAHEAGLRFGSYLNWNVHNQPSRPAGAIFWQMVRVRESGLWVSWEALAQVVALHPGSIWIVGNEPDVAEQDHLPPERYAELYHEVYTFIKARDPNARIAIGGVAQPTPLRRAYLDRILTAYEARYGRAMPIDVWTIHAFILREEQGSWGVGIPPGVDVYTGQLYEIEDHNNLEILRQSVIDFRAWMAERGYQDRPLAITEYGILMPADFGFPPELVIEFMNGAIDFFLTAANETGYPGDDGRLVQWWFWYSLYDPTELSTSNLFDQPAGQLTDAGQAFSDYINRLKP